MPQTLLWSLQHSPPPRNSFKGPISNGKGKEGGEKSPPTFLRMYAHVDRVWFRICIQVFAQHGPSISVYILVTHLWCSSTALALSRSQMSASSPPTSYQTVTDGGWAFTCVSLYTAWQSQNLYAPNIKKHHPMPYHLLLANSVSVDLFTTISSALISRGLATTTCVPKIDGNWWTTLKYTTGHHNSCYQTGC